MMPSLTQSKPVRGSMESLWESDADQLVEITAQGGPARVLVVAQAEQVDIPKPYSQFCLALTNLLFGLYFSDKQFRVGDIQSDVGDLFKFKSIPTVMFLYSF